MTSSQGLSANDRFAETFTVAVTGRSGATTTQDVAITVTGTNDAPVIRRRLQSGAAAEDGPLTAAGTVSASDVDHDACWASPAMPPARTAASRSAPAAAPRPLHA